MRIIVSALFLLLLSPTWAMAQKDTWGETLIYTFCDGNSIEACYLFFHGPIEQKSVAQFRRFVEDGDIGSVVFNSPGGNLAAAFEIGRIIHKHGLATSVGQPWVSSFMVPNSNRKFSEYELEIPNLDYAVCYSSCVYAFLGGAPRDTSQESKIGIHRFSLAQGDLPGEGGLIVGQMQASEIIDYLNDVDVPTELFIVASGTDNNDLYILSDAEIETLKVINHGGFGPFVLAKKANEVVAQTESIGARGAIDLLRRVYVSCADGQIVISLLLEYDVGFVDGHASLQILTSDQLAPASVAANTWGREVYDRSDTLSVEAIRLKSSEHEGFYELVTYFDPQSLREFSDIGWFEVEVFAGAFMSSGGLQSADFVLSEVERVALHAVTRECF